MFVYYGHTSRPASIRIEEHRKLLSKEDHKSSKLVEHVISTDHRVDWSSAGIVYKEKKWKDRNLMEAACMAVDKTCISQPSATFHPMFVPLVEKKISPARSMASEEHQALATFIKGVHQSLRAKSREVGADRAWLEHCHQTQLLQKYAESMKQLATEHWEKKNTDDKSFCRIKWVVDQCTDYFDNKGNENSKSREEKMSQIYFKKPLKKIESFLKSDAVMRLLDVGSCYNPFSKYSIFEVTALDIVPASEEVFKCDFLSVHISENVQIKNPCLKLPRMYFDVVVFSLLLEYIPSSKQRYKCCKNAFQLLKPEGLLFILTPDSKHPTANSKVMKSWRFALASIGFWRVSYQKMKHLHCMAYRRCVNPEVPRHWLSLRPLSSPPEDLLFIPQDFHVYQDQNSSGDSLVEPRSESDNQLLVDTFLDLPGADLFID